MPPPNSQDFLSLLFCVENPIFEIVLIECSIVSVSLAFNWRREAKVNTNTSTKVKHQSQEKTRNFRWTFWKGILKTFSWLNWWNIVEVLVFLKKVQSRFIFLSSLVRRFKSLTLNIWWIKLWKMSIIEANAFSNDACVQVSSLSSKMNPQGPKLSSS